MRLARSVEYALRAALFLACSPGRSVTLGEIARVQGIPSGTLSEVLRCLARRGIVLSRAGFKGGYRMRKDPAEVNLRQVIEAIEGPLFINRCLVHGDPCAQEGGHWCPVHALWDEAKRDFLKTLERHSLKELASRVSRWSSVDAMLREVVRRWPPARC